MKLSTQTVVVVRPLQGKIDLDAAVTLQREVWGYEDLDVDSRSMLTVASRFAGQVLGAFDGDRLVGFSLAFATLPFGRLHSHRVGVHPDYQNFGVGLKLKLAQREDALARSIPVIQWTFDPLQPRNAYFNLSKLGGVSRTYIPNLYGVTSSPLHGGLPTDRLLIEWELSSERVERTLAGDLVEVSDDVREILLPLPTDRRSAVAQTRLREELITCFTEGYAVTGLRKDGEAHLYILERP
jgi:predicted GNAT superfamily acetyltransferase